MGKSLPFYEQESTFVEIQICVVLPLKNRIKGEKFEVNDTISCIVKFVRFQKDGPMFSYHAPRPAEAARARSPRD